MSGKMFRNRKIYAFAIIICFMLAGCGRNSLSTGDHTLALNIGFVPFSPIASGLLSGKITPQTQSEKHDDVRNWVPQLSRRNIEGNQPIVEMLKDFTEKKNVTSAQISLVQTAQFLMVLLSGEMTVRINRTVCKAR